MSYVHGCVQHVIHQDDGFFVARVVVRATDLPDVAVDSPMVVAGGLCGLLQITAGVTLVWHGSKVTHPTYGSQFKPYAWEPPLSSTLADVDFFLDHCVEGFHDPKIRRLILSFPDPLGTLTKHPDEIQTKAASREDLALGVQAALLGWTKARSRASAALVLGPLGVSGSTIEALSERWGGSEVVPRLMQDPYAMLVLPQVTFASADRFAGRVVAVTGQEAAWADLRRGGLVVAVVRDAHQEGSLCVLASELPMLVRAKAERENVAMGEIGDLSPTLQRLEEQRSLRVGGGLVYTPSTWLFERGSAVKVAAFVGDVTGAVGDVAAFVEQYERRTGITLSEAQRQGVESLSKHRLLVLTGLPGTGKTTLVRCFVSYLESLGHKVALMAPTGIAAKRLAAVTGHDAATIHRTLRYDGEVWGYHQHHKFTETAAVIVDECSMVDQELFYRLLDALPSETVVVLVGDDNQLPSVGPGNVLRELLACPQVPHVRLHQIFRQDRTSEIVRMAHHVHRGELPTLGSQGPESEFQFVPVASENDIASLVVGMARKLKKRDANFQVLSPKYAGEVGVDNLNALLRDALNPDQGQRMWRVRPGVEFREGDRVVVTKNEYKRSLYNGDMAKVHAVLDRTVTLRVHGVGVEAIDTLVELPKDEAAALIQLAYAITVHKAQGCEFDTVILPVVESQRGMLQRNLFYTALTRAKQKVWVIGHAMAVTKAVRSNPVGGRLTRLAASIEVAIRAKESSA